MTTNSLTLAVLPAASILSAGLLVLAAIAVIRHVAPGFRGWGHKWRRLFTYSSRNRQRKRLIKTLDVLDRALDTPDAQVPAARAIRKTVQELVTSTRAAGDAELDTMHTFFKENPPPKPDWRRLLRHS